MIKKLPMLFILSLSISVAIASEQHKGRGHGRPELTDAQKTCLEGKLGARDSGNRPTREAMGAAMSACGVEKPKGPPPEEQQTQSQEETQTASE